MNSAVQEHSDDSFSCDNQELSQVSVMGTIKSVSKLSTNITLVVADETGEVEVRQWLDTGDLQQDFHQGMRIKIIGHVREFQEKRSILAFKIVPVADPQELVYHKLLATYVHLQNRFGPLPEGEAPVSNNPYQAHALQPQSMNQGGPTTDLSRAVVSYVKNVHAAQGASRTEIIAALKHLGGEHVIRDTIDNLCSEGRLYTSIDEEHFKGTTLSSLFPKPQLSLTFSSSASS